MLKNISRLECVVAGKAFHFTCDNDSNIEHVKEALFQFIKYIGQIEDQAQAAQAAQAQKEDLADAQDSSVNLEVKEEDKIEAISQG